MIKKTTLPMLIMAMVVQLAVPVSMIFYGQITEARVQELGAEYKIDINIASIQDGKVIFSPDEFDLWSSLYDNSYVSLATDENGKAYCLEVSDKRPDNSDYLSPAQRNTNKLDSYKVDYDGEILSSVYNSICEIDSYIAVKVYKGNIAVTGLYIEDLPVEDWLAAYNEDKLLLDSDKIFADEEINWEEENLFGE